ncbi:hypothetical protein [Microbacterium sp.]|uniref:hypothetical protein n=1 Tax=Microbacterium sp. TaxID=51671 RepID=UPI003A90D61C
MGPKADGVVETDDRRYVLVTEHGVNLIDSLPAGHVTRPMQSTSELVRGSRPRRRSAACGVIADRLGPTAAGSTFPQTWRRPPASCGRGR